MSLFNSNDLEYVVDNYNYHGDTEFENDHFGESKHERGNYFVDTEFEDDVETNKSKFNTSALEARNGKDIQGIPWARLNHTRENYRENRLKQYRNYESLSRSHEEINKECLQVEKGKTMYDFQFNSRDVKPTVLHFQLRNLLWATSKNDVYFMQSFSVMHWSSLLRRGKEILDAFRPIVPTLERPGQLPKSPFRVQISTMAIKDNLMVAGGYQGQLICKYVDKPGVVFGTELATDQNAITNSVDVYYAPSLSLRVMAANNDCKVRVFDVENFTCLDTFSFEWSVNNSSVSPDGKLVAVLGDSPECLIADAQSGKVTATLEGHIDYSFSSAWHPNGQILATGNQDTTCRLWDIRNLSKSLAVLKGNMGAIRALKFSSDGQFLAMGEPADFVHIFDTNSGYRQCQEIDLFGEIAGISFSPDTEALFVAVADRTYGGLLELNRRRNNRFLDSIF